MESNFDKFIRKSSCEMNDCPYGYEMSCNECVSRMIAEHDAKVKKELIDRLIDSVGHAGYCTAAGCPFYKKCGGCDECYISDRTEELIIAWLKEEQKE